MLVNFSSNNSTNIFYLDYSNADFDSMHKVFNDKFKVTLKACGHYFYQIFSPNISPLKTTKNVIYFI